MKTFVLKPDTLPSFRQMVDYNVSLSSIFQHGDSAGLSEEQVKDLIQQGVLDKNGAIAEEAKLAIETLATADRFCRIRFAGGKDLMESINYYSNLTNTIVSVTNREDGFYVNAPQNGDDIIIGIEQYIGDSVLKNFEFESTLDEKATAVFLGLVDLSRQHALQKIAQNEEYTRPVITLDAIRNHLNTSTEKAQWMANVFRNLMEHPLNALTLDFDTNLAALQNNGLIEKNEQGYRLAGSALGFENQFLITENIIRVDVGQEKDGHVFNSGFTVIQCGINDLLYFDYNGQQTQLETISSSRLIEYLDLFMNRLNNVKIAMDTPGVEKTEAAERPPAESEAESAIFCTECGAQLNPGAKFCHQCGNKLSEKPIETCPSCDQKVDDEMQFCIHCGYQLK